MDNFLLCVNGIFPLLLLMLLGYGLRRIHFIPDAGFDALDKLCFKIFIPVMLFSNVYYADFSTAFQLDAILFMEIAMAAVFLAIFLLAPRLFPNQNALCATLVHGVSHGNLAALGIPLINNLFGQDQTAVFSIMVACSSLLTNPVLVFEHTYFQGDKLKVGKMIWKVFTSPFLAGTLLGLFCMAVRIAFPPFIETFVANLKSVSSPLALIALGGSFALKDLKNYAKPVILGVTLKCVVVPAIVLGIAVALGFRGIVLASLLVIFTCPSATATFSYCRGYCGDPALASQLVVHSSIVSIFTIFLWLFSFLQLGLLQG